MNADEQIAWGYDGFAVDEPAVLARARKTVASKIMDFVAGMVNIGIVGGIFYLLAVFSKWGSDRQVEIDRMPYTTDQFMCLGVVCLAPVALLLVMVWRAYLARK